MTEKEAKAIWSVRAAEESETEERYQGGGALSKSLFPPPGLQQPLKCSAVHCEPCPPKCTIAVCISQFEPRTIWFDLPSLNA
jgi:hypothetical protein